MKTITHIIATTLLTMTSVAAFAQSASEIEARDLANMHAGDNYPVVIYHGTQTRAEVKADLVKAQQEGLIANGDDYPIIHQEQSTKSRAAVQAEMTVAHHGAESSLYSGA